MIRDVDCLDLVQLVDDRLWRRQCVSHEMDGNLGDTDSRLRSF